MVRQTLFTPVDPSRIQDLEMRLDRAVILEDAARLQLRTCRPTFTWLYRQQLRAAEHVRTEAEADLALAKRTAR